MKSLQFSVIKFIISFASFLHYSTANAIFCDPSGICIPCFYRCRTCSGLNQWQCTQCIPEYVLTLDGYCVPCTTNCKSCAVGTVNMTHFQVTQLRCQTCISGYYLSQARGTCLKCPTGASQCTLSSIQACKQEYFLLNGICLSCPQNCQTCSSSSACLQCDNGYYLSTLDYQTCLNCTIPNCKICDSQWNCIECSAGFSGPQCLDANNCGQKCAICYLSSCFACQVNYFLDADSGTCLPLEILCSATNDISVCGQCMSDISYMSQQTMSCVPFYSISDSKTQSYITAINNERYFSFSPSAAPQVNWCKFKQKNITYIYSANESSIQIGLAIDKPIYGFSIIMQVVVPLNYSNVSIWAQSLPFTNGTEQKIEGNAMPCSSSDGESLLVTNIAHRISLNNFNLSNSLIKNDENKTSGLYLRISAKYINSSNKLDFCSFGISELLVQFEHCTIQNCQICTSAFTCSSCSFPYLLEDNNCISECASGYYLTEAVQTCTLNCMSGYYPIFQNYSCLACQYPCTECESSGNQKCLKCQVGWFLQNDTVCVEECSQGFYAAVLLSNQGICDYCLYPCKTCTARNSNCTSCLIGYFVISENYCTSICKNNTYLIGLNNEEVCIPCKSPCLLCSSQTKCLSCMDFAYFYELNSSCVQECPNNTVGISSMVNTTEKKKCLPCSYPCHNCLMDPLNCTSCQSGFLFNFSCVQQCPIGYYANLQTNQCLICVFPCSQCISQFFCFKCHNITEVSLYEGICITKCPQTTYLSELENMCIKCMPPCATCHQQMVCKSCTSSMLILWQGKCLLNCPASTFLSQVNGTNACTNCSSGCLKCLSDVQCLKCNNSSYRMNLNDNMSECVNSCPPGYYAHQYLRQCFECSPPCLACLSPSQCLTCEQGYLYLGQQSKCYAQCPSGWVEDFTTYLCIQCDLSCLKCSNNTSNCTQCNDGYFLQPQDWAGEQKTCSIACPSTYYAEQYLKMCLPCEIPCQTCDSRSTCLSCISSVPLLYLMQCVSECPFNTFQIAQLRCQLCSINCLQCSVAKDNCTKCKSQMNLMESINANNTSGSCLSVCPEGYYSSEESVCYKCEPPCLNCEGSPTACSSCINLFFYYASNCLQVCPEGYFPNLNDNTCYPCSQECSKCEGTSNNCTDCFLSHAFLLLNDTLGECVINCPPGYYGDSITRLCKSCLPTCIECLSEGLCTQCHQGLFLFKDSCLTYCPEQFYPSNGTCLPCQSPCLKCFNMTECLSCALPFYFLSSVLAKEYSLNSCQTICPPGTYAFSLGIDMRECLTCSDQCLECFDYSACKNCKPNSTRPFLQQNDCLAECSPGFYYSADGLKCAACSDKCISCSSLVSCTQCLNSYLYEGKCIGFCPGGFYGDYSGLCLKCITPCQTCFDISNCVSCSEGYFLYETFCLEHCPKNMWAYPHDRTCRNTCDLPYFDDTNKLCLQKCPAYYKQSGNCIEECDGLGTSQIINSSMGCERCHDSCPAVPYMRLKFINKGYSHRLALIFSQNVELGSHLTQDQFTYVITEHQLLNEQTNQNPSASQLQQPKQRLLQTDSINLYPQDIAVMTSSLIMIQLEQISINEASGMIQLQINNQVLFTYNGYPLQNKMAVDEVSSTFVSAVSYSWVKYIGWMISFTFWALLLANVWLDNCKVMFLMVEILQSVHMMGYLDVWFHPIIEQLMQGLAFSAFYINTGQIESPSNIWQCTIKKILYLDYCNYTPYILSVCAFLILFILLVAGGKLTLSYFNPNRHKLCWNHVNDLYWIFSFTLFFIAFDHYKIVFATITAFFVLITLLIWYQSIKNIFTVTYAESTFFWALKKGKSPNPISNSNYPMAMCRRLILTVFISLKPQQSILVLSLTSLSTTLLAVNGIWNQPFKVHQRILPTIECLFAAFLFILQIIVINVKSLNNIAWQALSWIGFIIIITSILLCFWVVIEETIKIIKINHQKYKKYKNGDKKSLHPQTERSSDKESKRRSSTQQVQNTNKQQKQKSSLKEAICTNQIIINQENKDFKEVNEKNSPDQTEIEKQSSQQSKKESDDKQSHYDENSRGDGWSSSMSLRPKVGAAKYLIKINKKNGLGGEREKDYKRQ